MSLFDDLRANYVQWHQGHCDYESASMQFAMAFINGFKDHIGAPDHYLDAENREPVWYVQPLHVEESADGEYSYQTPNSHMDLLYRDEAGWWVVGLKLVLDRAVNSFPKSEFTYVFRFVLRDTICDMTVGFDRKEFSFPANDAQARKPVYDYMVKILKQMLALKPWDVPKKETIGFMVPHKEI
jgi:hypothetical protein